jgi:Ca2+-binding EF-hand superfamily protein
VKLTSRVVKKFMEKADINKDGKLTFDEFTAYMNNPELE